MVAVILTLVLSFLVGGSIWLLAGPRMSLSTDEHVNEVLNLLAYVGMALLPVFAILLFGLERL